MRKKSFQNIPRHDFYTKTKHSMIPVYVFEFLQGFASSDHRANCQSGKVGISRNMDSTVEDARGILLNF